MGQKLTQDIVGKIPILYEELGNKTEVARRLNISIGSVNKYLTVVAAEPIEDDNMKKAKKRIIITPELEQAINEEYARCKNMAEVARKFDITAPTVKNHLNEENLKLIQQVNDDRDALWYYIYRLFGPVDEDTPVSKWNITQMTTFKNQGMPYRGQLLTLKYFYEVKKSSIKKSNGSIGIIPYIYAEASQYYAKIEAKQKEISENIQKQLEKDRIEIKYKPSDYIGRKKKKKEIDLNSI